jgi:hypothetical protein
MLQIGARVKIPNLAGQTGKIVEFRGGLGPKGHHNRTVRVEEIATGRELQRGKLPAYDAAPAISRGAGSVLTRPAWATAARMSVLETMPTGRRRWSTTITR